MQYDTHDIHVVLYNPVYISSKYKFSKYKYLRIALPDVVQVEPLWLSTQEHNDFTHSYLGCHAPKLKTIFIDTQGG